MNKYISLTERASTIVFSVETVWSDIIDERGRKIGFIGGVRKSHVEESKNVRTPFCDNLEIGTPVFAMYHTAARVFLDVKGTLHPTVSRSLRGFGAMNPYKYFLDESEAIAEVKRLEQACRKRYIKKYGTSK